MLIFVNVMDVLLVFVLILGCGCKINGYFIYLRDKIWYFFIFV